MKKKELDAAKFPTRKSKKWKSSEIQLLLMAMLGIVFVAVFAYAYQLPKLLQMLRGVDLTILEIS